MLRYLNEGLKDHSDRMLDLTIDPAFEPFRSDAEFSELIRKVGFAR
jgi:hypothetical protein